MNIQFDHIPEFSIIDQFGPENQEISSIVYNSADSAENMLGNAGVEGVGC